MEQYENDFDKIEEEYRNKFNRTFPFFMYQCSGEEATEIMKKCIKENKPFEIEDKDSSILY